MEDKKERKERKGRVFI